MSGTGGVRKMKESRGRVEEVQVGGRRGVRR